MNKQRGASAMTMLVVVIIALLGFVTFLKVLPIYTDNMTAESVFANLKEESKSNEYTRRRVEDMIIRRFGINGIDSLYEHVIVSGKGSEIVIEMEYERRVPLAANMSLVASFSHYVDFSE